MRIYDTFHGLILIDKPCGITSHDVVKKIRQLFNTKKVGHAGTLDPIASGLLILMIGEATKLSDYLLNGDKTYETTICLGLQTDSGDIAGEVLHRKIDIEVSKAQIISVLHNLTGTVELLVPAFSAVKIQGRKLYEIARKKEFVPEIKRQMCFHYIEFLSFDKNTNNLVIRTKCSKGSYIRSLAVEVGRQLSCGAAVTSLRRLESQPFDVQHAITLQNLTNSVNLLGNNFWIKKDENQNVNQSIISIENALPHFPEFRVQGSDENLLRHGQISHNMALELRNYLNFSMIKIFDSTSNLLAILNREPDGFRINRIMNYQHHHNSNTTTV